VGVTGTVPEWSDFKGGDGWLGFRRGKAQFYRNFVASKGIFVCLVKVSVGAGALI
jgi:hypothetical protein